LFGGLALVAVVAIVLAVQVRLYAQPVPGSSSSAVIEEAVTLLNQGRPEAAQILLALIGPSDSNHALARGYEALCLSRTDRLKFLEAVQSSKWQTIDLPPHLAEELDYNVIDSLFFYRKFDEILLRTREFSDRHRDSPNLAAVAEYQMATLYERGMKKIYEGCAARDASAFHKRYEDGRTNLVDFLSLAISLSQSDYRFFPKRSLKEEIWAAQIALGNEKELQSGIPHADRERAEFINLNVQLKLQPRATGENLRRMTNFLNDFPNSKHVQRVRYSMADVALGTGERLAYEAEAAQRTGDTESADAKRVEAVPYLDLARELFSGVVLDPKAGIAESDVQESRAAILRVFFAKEDWASLSDWADHLVTDSKPGEKAWILAKLYDGAGLARQGKMSEAASQLDAVLATGFTNNPSYDGHVVSAAGWRIRVARETDDEATQRRVVQLVESSNCYGSFRRKFLKMYGALLNQSNPSLK
jgi:hypothetical protein